MFDKCTAGRMTNFAPGTSDLELRHLRYFVATSEALSFTRAARQLNVSQPALSHSISQLEERLGNKLFERSVKGIRLTPAGRVFEQTAHRVLPSSAWGLSWWQSRPG
jgi:DNA-binding transcriptional LysR family regulator